MRSDHLEAEKGYNQYMAEPSPAAGSGPCPGPDDIFRSIRGWAPEPVLELLDQLAFLLPDDIRYRLKTVMDTLPRRGDNMQKVLEVVRGQWREIQSEEELQVSVVGMPQAGKGALIRALTQGQDETGRPIFRSVGIQGLEEFVGFRTSDLTRDLQEADFILLVLDGRFEATASTRRLLERLQDFRTPLLVVLSKMDLVEQPSRMIRSARSVLGTAVFPVSVVRPEGIERLLKSIVSALPKALYPLTRSLPGFRRTICNSIVTQAAFSAALVGAVPIPVSDMLPLSAIQTAMILKIARAFGYPLNRSRARELLPLLASGALVREGGDRLLRRFPGKQHLLRVSVAGVWTFLAGQLAVYYFEEMRRHSQRQDRVAPGELRLVNS